MTCTCSQDPWDSIQPSKAVTKDRMVKHEHALFMFKFANPSKSFYNHVTTLLKKFTSKVDGFSFVHFCLKVITSDVKVLYALLMLYVRRYYLLREVA